MQIAPYTQAPSTAVSSIGLGRTRESERVRRLTDRCTFLEARIEQLAEALRRLDASIDALALLGRRLGLSPKQAEMFGAIASTEIASRERVMTALYGIGDSFPDPKVYDVMLCHMRPLLAQAGIEIETIPRLGWRIAPESRARIAALTAEGVR